MIRDDLKQLKTGDRDLRKFGLLVGGVFAALGVWFLLRHKPAAPYFLIAGVPLLLLGLLVPRALRQVYLAWMTVAFVLGLTVSTVLLTLFFFFVITPIGLAARCVGKDFLRLKLNRQATTYWIERDRSMPREKADYE